MLRKWGIIFTFLIIIGNVYAEKVVSSPQLEQFQNDDIHILIVYSHEQNKESENVKKLSLLLYHFTDNVKIVPDQDVLPKHIEKVTHLIYYGEHERNLDDDTLSILDNFTGTFLIIGKNREQFTSFQSFTSIGKAKVNQISERKNEYPYSLSYPVLIERIDQLDGMNVLLYGYRGSESVPLLIQQDHTYYFAVTNLQDTLKYHFAEILHNILPHNHEAKHVAYLRLEDIHPMSDHEKLLEIGNYLNERKIPYILVVIPVYITPDSGERVHFSSSPELVDVLQYLQETGGTVIAHGYTHQYRDSETGEGFEFWDVENDQFIIESNPNDHIESILPPNYFSNEIKYNAYINALKEKEREYIETRLEDSIKELVYYDLYPLGFEAPHYTMSQQGYSIVADYYSSVFGKLQLSDENWQVMGTSPYVTTAHFLKGMTLFPEAVGYVDMSIEEPFKEIEEEIETLLIVRDSMVGAFYHPFLGVDHLPELLEKMNKVPNLEWLDLKKTEQSSQMPMLEIVSDGTGYIHVDYDEKWLKSAVQRSELSVLEGVLWGVTILVLCFIVLFFIITIYLRTQLKKRLFKETHKVG